MTAISEEPKHRILQEEKLYKDAATLKVPIPPGLSLAATPKAFRCLQALIKKLLINGVDKYEVPKLTKAS